MQLFWKKMVFFHQLGNGSTAKSRFLAELHTRYGGEVEKKILGSEIIFNEKSCAAGARIIIFWGTENLLKLTESTGFWPNLAKTVKINRNHNSQLQDLLAGLLDSVAGITDSDLP